jgi:hypothetical protein
MTPLVESQRTRIAALCRSLGVRRLDVFGSALRDDFDPATSDIDFLVELDHLSPARYADAWLTLNAGLQDLLGRPVDLVTIGAIENPYFQQRVLRTRETLYAP